MALNTANEFVRESSTTSVCRWASYTRARSSLPRARSMSQSHTRSLTKLGKLQIRGSSWTTEPAAGTSRAGGSPLRRARRVSEARRVQASTRAPRAAPAPAPSRARRRASATSATRANQGSYDARSVDHGKPVRGFCAAHLHRVAEEADALTPQARRAIADDDPLGELRHRLRVAALSRVRKLVDRLVVATVGIERSSPCYGAQL